MWQKLYLKIQTFKAAKLGKIYIFGNVLVLYLHNISVVPIMNDRITYVLIDV